MFIRLFAVVRFARVLLAPIIMDISSSNLISGLSIITALFIPIAILVYQDFNSEHAFNEFDWDKTVLLTKVVNAKAIFASILSALTIAFIWGSASCDVRLCLFGMFACCIYVLSKKLVDVYKWFISNKIGSNGADNYKQSKKIDFLKDLDPNQSMDVWSELFRKIELENPYLIDYLQIFLKKLSEANEDAQWQYQICLTKVMARLYYWDPRFQKVIFNYTFNAFTNDNSKRNDLTAYKKVILRELIRLLVSNKDTLVFSISWLFDEKISKLNNQDVLELTREYSILVLTELLNSYDKNSDAATVWHTEYFPLHRWKITSLDEYQDSKYNAGQNAKAIGLFMAYFFMLRQFIEQRGGYINKKRAEFLDSIVFGKDMSRVSMKIIRVACLFFSQTTFGVYDKESEMHARVRNFIDEDYNFYFIDSAAGGSYYVDPKASPEERTQQLFESFRKDEDERDTKTFIILGYLFKTLSNKKALNKLRDEIEKVETEINEYDPKNSKYKYQTDIRIVKSNLDGLDDVIEKALAHISQNDGNK